MVLIRHTPECLAAAAGRWPASGVWTNQRASAAVAGNGTTKRSRPVAIRVFENGFIENFLAKAHPITPIFWFGPLIAYGVVRGTLAVGIIAVVGLYILGWLAWTLLEYVMHRFLFHLQAHTPGGRLNSFMMHGYHHEFPNDRMRLVAPPLMSWPLAAVVVALYVGVLGRDVGLALFAGTASGYVAYDWIHYYAHHFKPRNALGAWLKRYHLLHHHDATWATHRFGISSPLWDLLCGTYQSPYREQSSVAMPRAARREQRGA